MSSRESKPVAVSSTLRGDPVIKSTIRFLDMAVKSANPHFLPTLKSHEFSDWGTTHYNCMHRIIPFSRKIICCPKKLMEQIIIGVYGGH